MATTFTVERGLRLVAGAFVLISVVLGVYVSPWFFAFTAFVGANLLQSAFSNRCPMMAILRKMGLTAVLLALALVPPAAAQTTDAAAPGGTVAVIGGGAITSSTTGALVGGTATFDLTDRLAVEGHGAWFDRGPGADAFTLTGTLLVNILPLGSTAVPYAALGGGLYHASFDMDHTRLLGQIDPRYAAGNQFCTMPGRGFMGGPMGGFGPGFAPAGGYGDCPVDQAGGWWGVSDMPQFYARRLGTLVVPASGMWGRRSFTDPTVTFGGGVRLNIAPHLEIRPDARALVIFGGSDSHTVGVFGVNIGYRF